jgi:hypothetical protein
VEHFKILNFYLKQNSATSPKFSKRQGNSMVSGDGNCNVDGELTCDDHSSLSHCV